MERAVARDPIDFEPVSGSSLGVVREKMLHKS
jgi:hypothetical protein